MIVKREIWGEQELWDLAFPAREPKGPLALVVWYYIAKADMMFISRVLYAGLQGLLYSNLLLDSWGVLEVKAVGTHWDVGLS